MRRLEHASVANVPPECVIKSTGLPLILKESLLNGKQCCGIGADWPSWPSSLFAESVTMRSFGKTRCKSDAKASPSQSETSQPVTSKSTEPSCFPLS